MQMLNRRSVACGRAPPRLLAGRRGVGPARAIEAPNASIDQAMAKHKVAIFVEPSPFSHISGMKNRFECLIRNLRAEGDEVIVSEVL